MTVVKSVPTCKGFCGQGVAHASLLPGIFVLLSAEHSKAKGFAATLGA